MRFRQDVPKAGKKDVQLVASVAGNAKHVRKLIQSNDQRSGTRESVDDRP